MYIESSENIPQKQTSNDINTNTLSNFDPKNEKAFDSTISKINKELNNLACCSGSSELKISDEKKKQYDLMVKKQINNATEKKFEKKRFKFGSKLQEKTPIYNFFDSQTEFESFPKNSIDFRCIVCYNVYKEKISASTNLTSHLKSHNSSADNRLSKWFECWYESREVDRDGKLIKFYFLSLISKLYFY